MSENQNPEEPRAPKNNPAPQGPKEPLKPNSFTAPLDPYANQNNEKVDSSAMGSSKPTKSTTGVWPTIPEFLPGGTELWAKPMNLFSLWPFQGNKRHGLGKVQTYASKGQLSSDAESGYKNQGPESKNPNGRGNLPRDGFKLGENAPSIDSSLPFSGQRGPKQGANKSDLNSGGNGSGFKPQTMGSFGATLPKQPNLTKNKNKVVSVTYEEIGLFPRSFSRVFDRFFKQIFSDVENLVIQEYRFYRYLFLTTIKTLCILFIVPLAVNFIAKTYLIRPITEYFWNTQQTEIFLNSYEQKRAFSELQEFEEKLYFESLLVSKNAIVSSPFLKASNQGLGFAQTLRGHADFEEGSNGLGAPIKSQSNSILPQAAISEASLGLRLTEKPKESMARMESFEQPVFQGRAEPSNILKTSPFGAYGPAYGPFGALNSQNPNGVGLKPQAMGDGEAITPNLPETLSSLQDKILELAIRYNNHSIEAITNFFADFLSLITLLYLLVSLEIQINITKSFLLEVFFGLDDSKKSLLILIMTDLLVGYHSSNLWELFFQFIFNHYGIPESQTGIFLLVATLPVLLDVLFKYLIFRHLNRSSPATVATYHAILE